MKKISTKGYDSNLLLAPVPQLTTNTDGIFIVNDMGQGFNFYDRTGRITIPISLKLKGIAAFTYNTFLANSYENTLRIVVVWDEYPQGTVPNFNTIFGTNVYKTKKDGSFVYKKDKEGNDTTERELDGSKVAEVAKSLNFTEKQSAIFVLAVEHGNTQVVETLKQQAIFNMILPAIHNGEMGIQALEQQLNENTKFQEIIGRDEKSDIKDQSKTFVKEVLEDAKHIQKQSEKFQDFSKDVIVLNNDKATPNQKEGFLNQLNTSY